MFTDMKEWLASATINVINLSSSWRHICYDYGKNCIDCKYLKNKSGYFNGCVIKQGHKTRQNVTCQSKIVI